MLLGNHGPQASEEYDHDQRDGQTAARSAGWQPAVSPTGSRRGVRIEQHKDISPRKYLIRDLNLGGNSAPPRDSPFVRANNPINSFLLSNLHHTLSVRIAANRWSVVHRPQGGQAAIILKSNQRGRSRVQRAALHAGHQPQPAGPRPRRTSGLPRRAVRKDRVRRHLRD